MLFSTSEGVDKLLEMGVESHLVVQSLVDHEINYCKNHIKSDNQLVATDETKSIAARKLEKLERLKIGSRIWSVTFTEQSWTEDFSLISSYKKQHGRYNVDQVTFTMTEYDGEWEIGSDLYDHVIQFFTERGKVLNVPKLIDFVMKLSKTDKANPENNWHKTPSDEDEFYFSENVVDEDGNLVIRKKGYKVPELNIYDDSSKYEVEFDDDLINELAEKEKKTKTEIIDGIMKKVADEFQKQPRVIHYGKYPK